MSDTLQATAAVLIIGNEILSGKTQDANLRFLGTELAKLGIKLAEARVVRDEHDAIARHLNELRSTYGYVFTTGGIGPTHDDITAEAVAQAFGAELVVDEEAARRLQHHGRTLNEARLKMARIPAGASLVDNPVSHAPGFHIGNVFVFAGIPSVAAAMFEVAARHLPKGDAIHSASLDVFARESDIAAPLAGIAAAHPKVEIGSYPFSRNGRFGANLVVRGTDPELVDRVAAEIRSALAGLDTRAPD